MRRKQAGDSHAEKWWPLNVKKFPYTNFETEYFFFFFIRWHSKHIFKFTKSENDHKM